MADEKASPAGDRDNRDRRAPRFSWTPAYEDTFFRSLCESVSLGLRENNTFKPEAWDRAIEALHRTHGATATKSHLINKSDNARKRFRLWRGIREDPQFLYNPVTKTVTASDEIWRAHIEREPLSRALRGRPFEHEQYMEILYPDVVGSGGAPKRIMKPKRKTGSDATGDEMEMPGTSVFGVQSTQPTAMGRHSSSVIPTPGPRPPASAVHPPQPPPNQRPMSTTIPPRTNINSTVSALTPPEETATQSRKRGLSISNVVDPKPTAQAAPTSQPLAAGSDKRRRTGYGAPSSSTAQASSSVASGPNAASAERLERLLAEQKQMLDTCIELMKANSRVRYAEQAMDIFFKDFAEEDIDLQLRIAEKVLADENKALVFCKMPVEMRAHWVKKLRELSTTRSNQ